MSRIHEAMQKQQTSDAPEAAESNALSQLNSPNSDGESVPNCKMINMRRAGAALWFQGGDKYAVEQYRLIRTRILQHEKTPRVIAISSPAAGDGKTISAINIATVLSLTRRVVLVDADFRRSKVHAALGAEQSIGLAEVLAGTARLDQAISGTQQFNDLFIITAGLKKANAAELLQSPNWPAVCHSLRRQFDYIIVDTPPIGAVADYELVQKEMDGIIFVVRPDQTKKAGCMGALSLVPREKLLGAVVNCAKTWPFWRAPYGYTEYLRYCDGENGNH